MAIFPNLELEATLQVNDKTRLDARKSFVSKDEAAITIVEIEPEASAGFIDVTGSSSDDYFLDWEYATDGTKTVSARITTDGAPTTGPTEDIEVVTIVDDKLFSADSDLISHEPDILGFVPKGRSTYLNIHRRAQEIILAWLDEQGYRDTSGDRFTKAAIIDIQEVTEWSKFIVLRLIFQGLSNDVEDIFSVKAKKFESMEISSRKRSVLRLDIDGDGDVEVGEALTFTSLDLLRR